MNEWNLDNVKVGDEVWFDNGYGNYSKVIVVGETSTQLKVELYKGRIVKFTKKYGHMVGDASEWHPSRIYPCTDNNNALAERLITEKTERDHKNNLLNKITKTSFRNLSVPILETIWSIIETVTDEQDA